MRKGTLGCPFRLGAKAPLNQKPNKPKSFALSQAEGFNCERAAPFSVRVFRQRYKNMFVQLIQLKVAIFCSRNMLPTISTGILENLYLYSQKSDTWPGIGEVS
jgi:hypothetical protein